MNKKILPYWIYIHVYNRLDYMIQEWAREAQMRMNTHKAQQLGLDTFASQQLGRYIGERFRFLEEYSWTEDES